MASWKKLNIILTIFFALTHVFFRHICLSSRWIMAPPKKKKMPKQVKKRTGDGQMFIEKKAKQKKKEKALEKKAKDRLRYLNRKEMRVKLTKGEMAERRQLKKNIL